MRTASMRALAAVLVSVALAACGGSKDKTSSGPEDGSAEAAELASVLVASMQQAYFASLLQDSVTVQGQAGTLQIRGATWSFQHYSPDGQLYLDGQLRVPKDQFPNIPVQGQLSLSGSSTGTLVLDIVVTPQLGQGTVAATGTLTFNGKVWDVAQLMQTAAPQGA